MSGPTKVSDPAFQGVGQKVGTDIWRIENFQPVPLPKSDYGKFYMGDSYIILQTTQNKSASFLFDIHFWIGRDTSQDESGTAAIKSVELDAALGGRAVQHRELQGHESDKFLSYFKPCIIPLEGGVASGFRKYEEEEFETRLYTCKGRRVVKMKQVPFARSSLNHDDVFILDTEDKIYQFNGANSNIQERAKALEVVQYLKEKYHQGVCDVAIVDDGKLDTESDSGEFWVLFGGFAPIGKKASTDDDVVAEATPPKLYSIADGKTSIIQGELSRSLLENNKCYLLDCGSSVYVWVGRITQVEERKMANQVAEEFVTNQKRPRSVQITRLIQGYETHSFKSNFGSWPAGSAASGAEEGRGKVAALLKQQGVGIKGMSKSTQANEDVPPLLEGGGKMEVWYVNEDTKTPVASEDVGKFYSGDCYIILYAYHSGERKEDYLLYTWYGKDSVEDDQTTAARLASSMSNALKGKPVQGRVFQGKEPPQFVALFQPLVFFKGGVSAGYKKWIAEKGLADETYSADNISLIEISGTSVHNNKAEQVDHVATSLDSGHSFVLQTTSSLFIWHGSQCPFELQQSAVKVAEFLKPGVTLKHAKEGTESSIFWSALGGKQNYTSKKAAQDIVRDPHLYTISSNKGRFQVQEVFNFSQDDLLTEDVLILDTHAEVFVWIGQLVDAKEKQNAFEIGQSYIELAASLEGLPPQVPLYKVTEGTEPTFFTTYFSWDNTKAITQGNSFQKKVSLLFGIGNAAEDKTNASGGPRQRSEALAALNSAFNSSSEPKPVATRSSGRSQGGGSQRAAAVAALSNVLTAEKKQGSDSPPAPQNRSPHPDEGKGEDDNFQAEKEDGKDDEDKDGGTFSPSFENDGGQEDNAEPVVGTYTYDQLKAKSENPVTGIDFKRREEYLSPEEFETIFGVTKEAFSKLPKWKQNMQKKKFDLF